MTARLTELAKVRQKVPSHPTGGNWLQITTTVGASHFLQISRGKYNGKRGQIRFVMRLQSPHSIGVAIILPRNGWENIYGQKISQFMLLAAKFEFFLVVRNPDFARVHGTAKKVTGVNWESVASSLAVIHPFDEFDFASSRFEFFLETVPQYLALKPDGSMKWDSDNVEIKSWCELLTKGYAQLRNNVAHGNKALLPAPFTRYRTKQFITAATELIHFVAKAHGGTDYWNTEIYFQ